MIKFLQFLLLEAAAIGFHYAAGCSVKNIELPERTPEEIIKDGIKIVVFSLIAIAFAYIAFHIAFQTAASQKIITQKMEKTVGGLMMETESVFTGLLAIVCISRIVTTMFWLWKHRRIGKEPENEEQKKKKTNIR